MPSKKKDSDKTPQSEKIQENKEKHWTKEEMEEASPLPLPEVKREKGENEDQEKNK